MPLDLLSRVTFLAMINAPLLQFSHTVLDPTGTHFTHHAVLSADAKAPHSSPVRASYGVSSVTSNCDLYSPPSSAVICTIACYTG